MYAVIYCTSAML